MELFLVFFLIVSVVCAALWVNDQIVPGGYKIYGTQIATYLAVSEIRLFTNNITWSPNTVIGSLTEATFTGYAAQALATIPPPVNDSVNGGVSSFLPSHVFTCTTAPGSPVQVFGWYLTDTGGNLICGGNLERPVTIAAIGDSVPLQVTLNYPA